MPADIPLFRELALLRDELETAKVLEYPNHAALNTESKWSRAPRPWRSSSLRSEPVWFHVVLVVLVSYVLELKKDGACCTLQRPCCSRGVGGRDFVLGSVSAHEI